MTYFITSIILNFADFLFRIQVLWWGFFVGKFDFILTFYYVFKVVVLLFFVIFLYFKETLLSSIPSFTLQNAKANWERILNVHCNWNCLQWAQKPFYKVKGQTLCDEVSWKGDKRKNNRNQSHSPFEIIFLLSVKW